MEIRVSDRNAVALQAVRISATVPPLMVIPADVVGVPQVLPVAHAVQRGQHLAALDRMGLHGLEFFGGQPSMRTYVE